MTGLYQAIEARLALYKPLVSLQGRLDLVLAQAAPADPLSAHLAQGPLVSLPVTLCARIIKVALDSCSECLWDFNVQRGFGLRKHKWLAHHPKCLASSHKAESGLAVLRTNQLFCADVP